MTPEHIIATVNDYYQVKLIDLQAATRFRRNVEARQIGMVLLWELTKLNQEEIARIYNRDRCSVYHAVKTIRNLSVVDRKFNKKIIDIRSKIYTNRLPIQYYIMNLNT